MSKISVLKITKPVPDMHIIAYQSERNDKPCQLNMQSAWLQAERKVTVKHCRKIPLASDAANYNTM